MSGREEGYSGMGEPPSRVSAAMATAVAVCNLTPWRCIGSHRHQLAVISVEICIFLLLHISYSRRCIGSHRHQLRPLDVLRVHNGYCPAPHPTRGAVIML